MFRRLLATTCGSIRSRSITNPEELSRQLSQVAAFNNYEIPKDFRLQKDISSNSFQSLHLFSTTTSSHVEKQIHYDDFSDDFDENVEDFDEKVEDFDEKVEDFDKFNPDNDTPSPNPSLSTLIHSLRTLATSHNKELESSRSEHCSSSSFADFHLHPKLLERLEHLNYSAPFEIQAKTLKALLEGKNVIGQAVTGSGKTLAFAMPLVNALKDAPKSKGLGKPPAAVQALILTPTRELCKQITNAISELDPNLRCLNLYGGVPIQRDFDHLRRGVEVLCATPGRLRDHLRKGSLTMKQLKFLVLDEADEMLKDDWLNDLEQILMDSPDDKQVMLFSATMPPEVHDVARKYLKREMEIIRVKAENAAHHSPAGVNHVALFAPRQRHNKTVKSVIDLYEAQRTIVFVDTRAATNSMAWTLRQGGIREAQAIQGGMSQPHRERVLQGFRDGHFPVLVATDVAARGIDIPEVDLIVQIGAPKGVSSYLHRAGRTGRAGKAGLAVLIHSARSLDLDFIKSLKQKIQGLKELDLYERPQQPWHNTSRTPSNTGFNRGGGGRDNFRRNDYDDRQQFRNNDYNDRGPRNNYGHNRSLGNEGKGDRDFWRGSQRDKHDSEKRHNRAQSQMKQTSYDFDNDFDNDFDDGRQSAPPKLQPGDFQTFMAQRSANKGDRTFGGAGQRGGRGRRTEEEEDLW